MNENTKNNKIIKTETILKEKIINEEKINDYIFSIIILLGSLGFLIVGISTYTKSNLLNFLNAKDILFFPQGITMCFYGTCGLIISIYQLLILFWEVGEGYNKFDKEKGIVEIFRKGYPGENSEIKLIYPLKDIVRI